MSRFSAGDLPAAAGRHRLDAQLSTSPMRVIETDAGRDRVGRDLAWALSLTPMIGTLLLGVTFILERPSYYFILQEDHPVEWAQFSLCLVSSLVAAAAAAGFAARRQYGTAILLALVALTCLGLAGEEISWGQRVFNLAEPAGLSHVNGQDELNVHNTEVDGIHVDDLFKLFSFGIGIAGAGLACAIRGPWTGGPVLRGPFWWQVAPPLFTIPGFAGMALYRPISLVAPEAVAAPVAIFQEWAEFGLYLSLAATVICILLRVAPQRSRFVLQASAFALVVTVLFAILTVHFGIVPGNVTD